MKNLKMYVQSGIIPFFEKGVVFTLDDIFRKNKKTRQFDIFFCFMKIEY